MIQRYEISILWCWKYGTRNFTGIVNSNVVKSENIYLTNRSNEDALKKHAEELGVQYSYDDEALLKDADYVFLGTKPYDFDNLSY